MSEFVKTQQELRGNLVHQIQETIDSAEAEGRGLSAEETEKIDRIEADIRKADEAISVAQRNEERKAEASLAARGFVVAEQEERSAGDILRGLPETRGMHTFEKRDIVSSANTVPKSFFDRVFDIARLTGPMLETSEIINTTSGEDLTIPTLTNYGTATLTAEGSAIEENDPTYSSITLGAFRYGQLIQVSRELVTDAGFDIEAHLANAAGNALGFAANLDLTTGNGSDKPNGIANAASTGCDRNRHHWCVHCRRTDRTAVQPGWCGSPPARCCIHGQRKHHWQNAYPEGRRWQLPVPGAGWTAGCLRRIRSCGEPAPRFHWYGWRTAGSVRSPAFVQSAYGWRSRRGLLGGLRLQRQPGDLPVHHAP